MYFPVIPSVGNVVGHWVKVVQTLQFLPGYNDLILLSEAVGLQVKFLHPLNPYPYV